MNTQFTTQDIGPILRFPFEDPDWQRKLLVAGVIALAGFIIPLVPWILLAGYGAELTRRVIQGQTTGLPDWDDWGQILEDGLKVSAAYLIYSLPLILLGLLAMGSVFLFPLSESLAGSDSDALAAIFFFLGMAAFIGMIGVIVIFGFLLGIVAPAGIAHLIARDDFGAAFRFREWWPLFRANLGGFVLVYVVIWGISFVAGLAGQILALTLILICLMPFAYAALYAYLTPLMGVLYGAAYREGTAKAAVPAGPSPVAE